MLHMSIASLLTLSLRWALPLGLALKKISLFYAGLFFFFSDF